MASFDIFAPQISTISYDLAGKSMLVYGTNRTGKTKNMCALPKPCYLMFENGLNAIPGIPFFRMNDWRSYTQFVKQITDPANEARAHEMYQTIILDTAEIMGNLCASFVCTKFGVQSLGEKKFLPNGKADFSFNGYNELNNENRKWLYLLLNSGFTVVYIAHDGVRDIKDESGEEYSKIYPRGDKRIIDAICDAVDIIAYAVPNGIDDQGQEIKSSLVLANSKRAQAGSRFTYLPPFLKEFTADNLVAAVNEAIRKEEEVSGMKAVSFKEQQKSHDDATYLGHESLVEQIGAYAQAMIDQETGAPNAQFKSIVAKHLGDGARVMETTPDKDSLLEKILAELKNLNI